MKEKDPKKMRAGRMRWLSMSAKERKEFTSNAGKKGGPATAKKWAELQGKALSTPG